MAELIQKNQKYYVRFRLDGKRYKKSLKTTVESDAEGAKDIVNVCLYRIHTGQLIVPPDVDPGEFVVSGGTCTSPKRQEVPTLQELVDEFAASQKMTVAESWSYTQSIHLRHLIAFIGKKGDVPCSQIGFRQLDAFLRGRLAKCKTDTVKMERSTLVRFFNWAVRHNYYTKSPAEGLDKIKAGADRPPFRTSAEIANIIKRGGLDDIAIQELWDTLYLTPKEIGQILGKVRQYANSDYSYLLHAIPAYTGLRRGEVLRLRWVDIDLSQAVLTARSKKQSRQRLETARHIDIHPMLLKELTKWKKLRRQGQWVLCKQDSTEQLTLDEAKYAFWQPLRETTWCLDKKKRSYKIGFHTYRHSFASNLAAAGIDQRIIDELMGHTSDSMRKRYRHLFPRLKTAAVDALCYSGSKSKNGG